MNNFNNNKYLNLHQGPGAFGQSGMGMGAAAGGSVKMPLSGNALFAAQA